MKRVEAEAAKNNQTAEDVFDKLLALKDRILKHNDDKLEIERRLSKFYADHIDVDDDLDRDMLALDAEQDSLTKLAREYGILDIHECVS